MGTGEERIRALAALQAAGAGSVAVAALEKRLGPLEGWWPRRGSLSVGGGDGRDQRLARLLAKLGRVDVARSLRRVAELGYRPVPAGELAALGALPDPPPLLYVRGELPSLAGLAVVGARRASAYGRRLARRLAGEVAASGVPVISGLARGVDGEAHAAALEAGGFTVAVLGAGPDRVYPPEHARMLGEIEERGAVVTEHLPGVAPRPHHFPRRNRIMVALCAALLVVEARIKSGTLTSVRWAADLGRDVLVVPGPVDHPLGEGPLTLLREGAVPVGTLEHVLEALGREVDPADGLPSVSPPTLGAAERRLLVLLGAESLDLDEIVRASGEAPGHVFTLLLGLEARGLLDRDSGMAWSVSGAGRRLLAEQP